MPDSFSRLVLWCAVCWLGSAMASASELREVTPVTDGILMLHFADGHAVHGAPGRGEDERVELTPLDIAKASAAQSYQISSSDDPAYAQPQRPMKVGRKTKGRDFVNNHGKIEFVPEHWIYLVLPSPMQPGKTYSVLVGDLSADQEPAQLVFDTGKVRSETVHVNQIGYLPQAPMKFAYLSAWMGDLGPLSLDPSSDVRFQLIDVKTGQSVFEGKPTLRKRLVEPDNGQTSTGPHANYFEADLWQCDFSAFSTPGEYVVAVDRIGCSFPFRIDADVYRKAFITTIRGLYHQRCGTELNEPFTKWVRAACHRGSAEHPIMATTDARIEQAHNDGDPNADSKVTGEQRNDCWGGWHDAGDWDRESWHPDTPATLLLIYELAPTHFADGEQSIPESGNGIPDIIDEARSGIDYYRRIQRPDGGVSCGLYEESFPKLGMTSATDPMKWYMYAEDPEATYKYAALAARLAWCLKIAGQPDEQSKPYLEAATKAWDWAQANTKPQWEQRLRDVRLHAAAAMYKATGEARYHEAFKKDLVIDSPTKPLLQWQSHDQQWGVWTYITTDRPDLDQELKQRLTQAAINFADNEYVQTADKRGNRTPGNWWWPLSWACATEPRVLPLIVAHHLTKDARFLGPIATACDNTLGGNAMNMVWVTGLGRRSPQEIMHWDSWYGVMGGQPVPGILVMGPHHYTEDAAGPWVPGYTMKTFYPDAKTWPPYELWTDTRLCPPTNEFTIGQIANGAAAFGYLCADRK